MNALSRLWALVAVVAILALAAMPSSTNANHAWGNYHWARTSNPFTITVVDSMTSNWDDNLAGAISDWNSSSVMNLNRQQGDETATSRKRCAAISGKARSCNAEYGTNGWLGLAQIWASGSHIVQATAKMNDSYLATSRYTETNRQHVICQEIGHDWGLGHQDESGADLNTCMDYSNALDNPRPNAHDYAQLEQIYSHLDGSTTIGAMPENVARAELNTPAEWGKEVHSSGRNSVYVRDFGNGIRIITSVTWVEERGHRDHH
ncbi:MAG TPA: hypothetical protein VFZ66_12210 [Herpetosiphonaceae bacterium]